MEATVLELIALGRPLEEVLDTLVRAVESLSREGAICSVLLLDQDGRRLRHGAAPGLPAAYCQAIDGIEIGPRVGSCGTAAFSGKLVIVTDIASDPLWADFSELAASHGLRACWSTPIKARSGKVLGTFAIYYRDPRAPSAADLGLIERAQQLARIVLERDAAEQALAEKSALLRTTLEHMDQGISVVDADLKVVGWNRRFLELLDFPESLFNERTTFAEVIRFNAQRGEYGPGEVEEQVRQRVELARRFQSHRFERVRPDGTVLEIRGVSLAGGGFVTTYADITERKRAEQALSESEDRYRKLIDVSPDAIFVHSDWRIVLVNQAMLRLFRAEQAEQLLGREVLKLITPESREIVRARITQLYEQRLSVPPAEVEYLRADGTRFSAEVTAASFIYAGRPAAQVVARDISERMLAEQTLRNSEERFRDLTELSADWYWEQDAEFRFVDMSIGAQTSVGISPQSFIGRRRWDLPWINMTEQDWAEHRAMLERHEPFHDLQLRRREASGEVTIISVSGKPVFDPHGRFTGYRGVGRNITQRKHTKRSLREIVERFRSLTELSSDWYWEMDAELRFTYVSEGIRKVRGVDPASLIGKRRWELDHVAGGEDMARHRAMLEARQPFSDFVYPRRGADGRITYVSHSGTPIFDENGSFRGYRGVARDITARKQADEELARLAHFDTLTGLPNRALLQSRLRRAMARADRAKTLLAVMFLDLDQFKEINDTLGHAVGDQVLKEAALRLERCLRATDTVARLGGDEFTVLLEEVRSVDEISGLAEKLRQAVSQRAEVAGHELYLSTSIGVTVYPLDDQDADTLLRNADIAMYQAKQEGRNNFQFFSRDMGARTEKRVDLTGRLRGALERGELVLHYQPLVDAARGRIVGAEALLRWRDAELGMVSPAEFIPVAEETGLIQPIGEWVLRTACAQGRAWLDAGFAPLAMSVNLSPRQFREKDLVGMVQAVLRDTGLPAASLDLEITEGAIMHRAEEAVAGLARLQELGVRISVDDFGTGHSSLAYLQRFPVHTLKIDQSFVREIRDEGGQAAIVSTVITLAKSLGMRTLAEGVETDAQLAFLRVHGCDAYQGYLFSRPLPAAEVEKLLSAQFRPRPALKPLRPRARRAGPSSADARTGRGRRRAT